MNRILTGIGLLAAVVLIAASATMNYLFMSSLGKSWLESQVLGAVSVAADVLKAIVVVLVAAAARDGRRTFVVVGSLAFVLFSLASLVAATGFAAQNRGAVTDGSNAARSELARVEREFGEIERKLSRLPEHRPRSVVEAALAGHEVDPRWRPSGSCRQTVTPSLREFCRMVSDRREELAAAVEAGRLESEMQRLRARVAELSGRGANRMADPQARLLAEALNLDESTVQRLLMALLALVVEVASGLGIYLATGHGHMFAEVMRQTGATKHSGDPLPLGSETPAEKTAPASDTGPSMTPRLSATPIETVVAARHPRRHRVSIGVGTRKSPDGREEV